MSEPRPRAPLSRSARAAAGMLLVAAAFAAAAAGDPARDGVTLLNGCAE